MNSTMKSSNSIKIPGKTIEDRIILKTKASLVDSIMGDNSFVSETSMNDEICKISNPLIELFDEDNPSFNKTERSKWNFDKNLLDNSQFRKTQIKKEKLEIECKPDKPVIKLIKNLTNFNKDKEENDNINNINNNINNKNNEKIENYSNSLNNFKKPKIIKNINNNNDNSKKIKSIIKIRNNFDINTSSTFNGEVKKTNFNENEINSNTSNKNNYHENENEKEKKIDYREEV
jgi:hypothetical protein